MYNFSNIIESNGNKAAPSPPDTEESVAKEREIHGTITPSSSVSTDKPETSEITKEFKESDPSTLNTEPPSEESKDLKRHTSEDDDETKKKKRKDDLLLSKG